MFEVDAAVRIGAAPAEVWRYLVDVQSWWVASNPEEHRSLRVLGEGGALEEGTPIRIRESVAGVPCDALGYVTRLVDGKEVTWTSGEAVYRYAGLRMSVEEGVTWSVRGANGGSELEAHVWAIFPGTLLGRLFEWYAKRVLRVERRDREHAMKELTFIKQRIEARAASQRG